MKRTFSTLFLLCAVWTMPMQADYTTTTITEQGSLISAVVEYSDDFLENEKEDLDLCLRHVEDKGYILAFHYYATDVNDVTMSDVYEYVDWLADNLYSNHHDEQFSSGNETEYSFIAVDEFGKEIYCTIRLRHCRDKIIYSVIGTSYLSFDDAKLRVDKFQNLIYWKIR